MGNAEIMPRIERRRKWTVEEKAALLAEVEAEGGKVKAVARRHGISDSVLYNWRSAWKMAAASMRSPQPVEFLPVGELERTSPRRRDCGTSDVGRIEIDPSRPALAFALMPLSTRRHCRGSCAR